MPCSEDIRIDAVKIGMLANADIIAIVAERLAAWQPRWIVLDPVMVAKGGHRLLDEAAITALRQELMPLATVVTPNLPEAAALLDRPLAANWADMIETAHQLAAGGQSGRAFEGRPSAGRAQARTSCSCGDAVTRLDAARIDDSQYPWHRLHIVGGHCRLAAAAWRYRPRRAGGQSLCHWRYCRERAARCRPRPRSGSSFSSSVAAADGHPFGA